MPPDQPRHSFRHPHAALQREADAARALIQAAVDATAPALAFHGHWHQQNRCQINRGDTEVIGLAADGHPGSAAVLSITDLQARHVHMTHRPNQQAGGPQSTVPASNPTRARRRLGRRQRNAPGWLR